MGVKSTYDIDRATALTVILSKVHKCNNNQLSMMLEEFDESEFRNYIVRDNLPEINDEWDKQIKTVSDF